MQVVANVSQVLKTLKLSEILSDLFIVLNDREKDVLIRRFAINRSQKSTLEAIGQDLNVTRERVRQIESLALKKLRRTCPTTAFAHINELTKQILTDFGGVLTELALTSQIIKSLPQSEEADRTIIRLSLAINPDLKQIKKSKTNRPGWHLNALSGKDIKLINATAIKLLKENKDVVEETSFISQLQKALAEQSISVNPKTIASSLTIDNNIKLIAEGYGLTKWRHVEPKSIRDKALIIMRRQNKPMHFVEIANAISNANFSKKQVTTQAVHNELIRYDDFVLVGRGLYALKTWGYQSGTVRDVIRQILEDNGQMKKQDIIKAVLERRHVKTGTISLNLQKYPEFERVGRALYRYNAGLTGATQAA